MKNLIGIRFRKTVYLNSPSAATFDNYIREQDIRNQSDT